eukprot:CAMPEP_0194750824 /NCGR_PEP_ID=MMETSP0323_2-20130528/4930_1 /TAXON_ID=2866 ORGANISM="Crypthecodinium cohnii, Strain Seligo" /NCGR_SAMPLE_ID=MMETSP0323_2 /ASSEMBLY_ACC=CAM_ASM_000346 /LENGTH=44 /DNA_ID= /DNA_START= /DNA_END= /DNA_ORIENTATION=
MSGARQTPDMKETNNFASHDDYGQLAAIMQQCTGSTGTLPLLFL